MATVLVNLTTRYDKRGLMYLAPTEAKVYRITAWMVGGKVRVTSGDVWKVRRCESSAADYIVDEPAG